jgi:hypothetical protein
VKVSLQKATAAVVLTTACTVAFAAPVWADPATPDTQDPAAPPTAAPANAAAPTTAPGAVQPAGQTGPHQLHNVTYRARVDGVARGALVTYKINDTQVQSTNPTMLPGRVFEADSVLSDPKLAGMQVSIQWPYSANLHCEILVDDETVAQADEFIRPRLTPANNDPDFGRLTCGAPLINPVGTASVSAPVAPPGDTTAAPAPTA